MDKLDLKSLSYPALADFVQQLGQPGYRAKQIFRWLHQKQVQEFDQMSDLSLPLRTQLSERSYINSIKIKKKLVSKVDGTVKYLYELSDGNCIETVLMQYRHGYSLCISTQVGCRMGCKFCASTLAGLTRNLTAGEMLDQVYMSGKDMGVKIGSIVLMGIGEPLDNLDNVLDFLGNLSSPDGLQLSLRHVSLSTCGLVDKIRLLAEKKLPLTLSISLHAPNDAIRGQTMPVNNRWPVEELLGACREYFQKTGRRISYEYALIQGVNDATYHAGELATKLKGHPCHVNLIPVNTVAETGYCRSSGDRVEKFKDVLEGHGITVTVRRELGTDISAACGQLRKDSLTPMT